MKNKNKNYKKNKVKSNLFDVVVSGGGIKVGWGKQESNVYPSE
jgi:hypothetical protein